MITKTQLDQIIKREAERIIREKYKCLGSVADSNVTLGCQDCIAGAKLLAEPLLLAIEALKRIDKYWFDPAVKNNACGLCDANMHENLMGKHGSVGGGECELQIAHEALERISKMLGEENGK